MNVQKPVYFQASFTTTESHDVASNALIEKSVLVFISLIHSEIRPRCGTNEPYHWQNTHNELATYDRKSQVNDHSMSGAEDREDFVSTFHYNRRKVPFASLHMCSGQPGPMYPFHPLSVLW